MNIYQYSFYIGGIALYIYRYIYLYVLFIVSNRPLYLCCTFADDMILCFRCIVRFVTASLRAYLFPPLPSGQVAIRFLVGVSMSDEGGGVNQTRH